MTNAPLKIGYVHTATTSAGFVGAILVSDEKGFPLEFQYTDPIAPTKLQEVLYGNSLEKYLKVDVILDNLLKVLTNKVDLLIVKDEQMLDYRNTKTDMVRIAQVSSLEAPMDTEIQKNKDNEYLMQFSKTSNPLRVSFKQAIKQDDELFTRVANIVKELSSYIDVIEPLERVQKAIDVIILKEKD